MKKVILQLETLTCSSCVKKIDTVLNKAEGVNSAEVLFNSSKVKVQFDETQTDAAQLEKVISNLGFSVLSTKESQ